MAALSLGFDAYERRARLYPGLIAIFPAVAVTLALFPSSIGGHFGGTLVAIFSYVGVFYLLANLARSEGKKIEPRLLLKWGGWPTNILLRHRDNTIDAHTKKRYHDALAKLASDFSPPTLEEEQSRPDLADDAYRSATKRLLELRRGTQYQLVHKENAEYGFRRNMLWLKPWAIGISVLVGLTMVLVWSWQFRHSKISEESLLDDLGNRWLVYALFLGDLILTSFWVLYVTEAWVGQAAFGYADALFRTLEPPARRSPSTKR
jgi:hypothetical protein